MEYAICCIVVVLIWPQFEVLFEELASDVIGQGLLKNILNILTTKVENVGEAYFKDFPCRGGGVVIRDRGLVRAFIM